MGWARVLRRLAYRTESTTAFLDTLAAGNLSIASTALVSLIGAKWTAGGCLLDLGPPAFSAGVVCRRVLFACHRRLFYELQGNNRNPGALVARYKESSQLRQTGDMPPRAPD
jgi:hypothetical protein